MKTGRKGEVNDNAERVSETEATTEKNRPEILLIKGFVRSLCSEVATRSQRWGHHASATSTLCKAARLTPSIPHVLSHQDTDIVAVNHHVNIPDMGKSWNGE